MRIARAGIALTAAALITTSSCGGADLSKHPGEKLSGTVEADLFSGRPNPTWPLTPEEVAQLVERIDRLAPAAEMEPPGRLGFRGFVFRLYAGGRETALGQSYDGHVRFQDSAGPRHRADPEGEFERWLLETGQGRIEPQLYETLRNESSKTRKKEP